VAVGRAQSLHVTVVPGEDHLEASAAGRDIVHGEGIIVGNGIGNGIGIG
jgi:hypothetical protein